MKLIRASRNRLSFHLRQPEKQVLLRVLRLYPRVPPAHHQLSKSSPSPNPQENQRLLDQALAEQRAENTRQVEALLTDRGRLEEVRDGWRLSLSRAEADWLLQVLNDIRVGSWVALGSPDELPVNLDEKTAPDYWAMEMAGFFQMHLLHALNPAP